MQVQFERLFSDAGVLNIANDLPTIRFGGICPDDREQAEERKKDAIHSQIVIAGRGFES
jgi:hypothetical protein